jgi:hypothetical protein
MEPIGKKKHLEQAEQAIGEPVEAVTTVSEVISYASQRDDEPAEDAKPQRMLTLVVTGGELRLFDPSDGDPYLSEVVSQPCDAIARIQRKSGTFGERVLITFAGGEQLQFRALRGGLKGPAVVDLLAQKASVSIEPL